MHNPRWVSTARHTAFLDQLLSWLDIRMAPAELLRRLGSTHPIPDEVPDDQLWPFTRLVIQEPPRHGKSEHISRYFTAWYLGRHPHHHVILTSYQDNFAATWGRKSREVLEMVGEEAFGVTVSRVTSARNDWELNGTGGGMITAGVGGAITGRGANLLVVDDPVKDARDAASEVMQTAAKEWWDSTAYSRLEVDDEGLEPIALIIQTRWNEADLTGQVLAVDEDMDEEDVEQWFTLSLPALAEANDPLGREVGEPLWPERRSKAFLERIKARIPAYWWSALYQQHPTPLEGDIFQRRAWQFHHGIPPGPHRGGIFVDSAGYDTRVDGDSHAFATLYRVQNDMYWDNAASGRWTFPDTKNRLIAEAERTGLPIYIEETALSIPLIQALRDEKTASGISVIGIKVRAKKEYRGIACQPAHEAGRFWLPSGAKWVDGWIDNHAAFPNGEHDDPVDTTSLGYIKLFQPVMEIPGVDGERQQQQRRIAARPRNLIAGAR